MKRYITRDEVKKDVAAIKKVIKEKGVNGNFGMPDDISFKDEETNTIFICPINGKRVGAHVSDIAEDYWKLSKKENCNITTVFNGCLPYELSPDMTKEQARNAPLQADKLVSKLYSEHDNIQKPEQKLSVLRARMARKIDSELKTNMADIKLPKAVKKAEEKVSKFMFKKESNEM